MRARAAALGVAAVVLLTGCSALTGFGPTASPSPSGSSSPSDVPLGPAFGDVAPRESITDDLGTYLHVTISPASAAYTTVDPSTVDPSIAGSSWDEQSLLEAQRFVATFVAEQTIDSIALDRDETGWEEWVDSTSELYFGPDSGDLMKLEGADRPTPIYNDPDNFTPRLVRDGLARLDDATITIESLANEPREGGEWLTVTGTADVAYRLSDRRRSPRCSSRGTTRRPLEGFEALNDGDDGHYLTLLTWSYSVERVADGWMIRAYDLDLGVDHRGRLAGLNRPASRRPIRLLLLDRRDDQSDDRGDDRSGDAAPHRVRR